MRKTITDGSLFVTMLIVATWLPSSLVAENKQTENRPIGIISALAHETDYLKSSIKNPKRHAIFGRNYYTGKLGKQDVVIGQVGIGIVNASVGTAILIEKFNPKAIIMTGAAGGTTKTQPGNVIIAKAVTFYDLGMMDKKGKFTRTPAFPPTMPSDRKDKDDIPLFFDATPKLLSLAQKSSKTVELPSMKYKNMTYPAKIIEGIITTTQVFCEYKKLVKSMMKTTGCIAFEMEGAGPAQVCYNQKVPYILIRSISDDGDSDMYKCLKDAAAKNAELLIEEMMRNK